MHRPCDLNRFWPLPLILACDRLFARGSSAPGELAHRYQAAP